MGQRGLQLRQYVEKHVNPVFNPVDRRVERPRDVVTDRRDRRRSLTQDMEPSVMDYLLHHCEPHYEPVVPQLVHRRSRGRFQLTEGKTNRHE